VINAGLRQELSFCRITIIPFPRLAPIPMAALTTSGITATAYARERSVCIAVFSGILKSFSSMSAASPIRFSSGVAACIPLLDPKIKKYRKYYEK
jgi:hypothetical protein